MDENRANKTASRKVLKTIEWFIDIPGDLKANEDRVINSSTFLIEFNKVVTTWRLGYNLNAYGSNNFTVYLSSMSFDKINFGFQITLRLISDSLTVTKSSDAFSSNQKNWKDNLWSVPTPYTTEQLITRFGLSQKQKLQVHVTVHLVTPNIVDIKLQPTEVENSRSPTNLSSEFFMSFISVDAKFITLKSCDGQRMKAHKEILVARSPKFKRMLEKKIDEIQSLFTANVLHELLRFIHFREVENIDRVNLDLFKAAKYYDIVELPGLCVKSIMETLSYENVMNALKLAELNDLGELFEKCCEKLQTYMHYDKIQSELDGLEMRLQKKILSRINKSLLASSRITAVVETFDKIESNKLASVAASPAKIASPKVSVEPSTKSPMFVIDKQDKPMDISAGMKTIVTWPLRFKNSPNPKRQLHTEDLPLEDFKHDNASMKVSTPKRQKLRASSRSRKNGIYKHATKYNSSDDE